MKPWFARVTRVRAPPDPAPAVTGSLLFVAAGVAVGLRLVEPLTSGLIGGQDPYMHLAHTRSVLDAGAWPLKDWGGALPRPHYPPGLHALLGAIVATTGIPRYSVARWLPALLGALVVPAVFFLALRDTGATRFPAVMGALTAAVLAATTPELVYRGNVLIPTALDIVIVPVAGLAFVGVLRDAGARVAWAVIGSLLVAALLVAHPWVLGILALALGAAVVVDAGLAWRTRATALAGAAGVGGAGLAFLLASNWFLVFTERTPARFAAILADPVRELSAWPAFVDYPNMLGWPLILLAVAGVVTVIAARVSAPRTRAGVVGLGFTLALLPITRVDWFGLWYVPHRVVPFLALGLALLAGVAVAWFLASAPWSRRHAPAATPALAVAVVTLVLAAGVPTGLSIPPWWELYGVEDHAGAAFVDARADVVIVGSWEGRWLVRALTDVDWVWAKPFYYDADAREALVQDLEEAGYERIHVLVEHGVRVQVDGRRGPAYDLSFLGIPPWETVFERGGVRVYAYDARPDETETDPATPA